MIAYSVSSASDIASHTAFGRRAGITALCDKNVALQTALLIIEAKDLGGHSADLGETYDLRAFEFEMLVCHLSMRGL